MAVHSNILAWRTPRTEEPGGLQSMGSQKVRHDCVTDTHTYACITWSSSCPSVETGVWGTKLDVSVIQSDLTLCDPMDCGLPGSSVHEILQARILVWVAASLLQRIFPTQGLSLDFPHCRQILYHLSHQGSQTNKDTMATGIFCEPPQTFCRLKF